VHIDDFYEGTDGCEALPFLGLILAGIGEARSYRTRSPSPRTEISWRSEAPQRRSEATHARFRCESCARDSLGRIARSRTLRRAFQHVNPCPSTGEATGACPGYVADHVIPLRRGGRDAVENIQWRTRENAKSKDRTE
jgi:hypothetical protein